ncbi:MAG: flotillin domain-containing protein [Pseudomonadota bacterium]
MDSLLAIFVPIFAIVALLFLVGLTLSRLWRRATREVSLVRTGAGGKRVIMDGGCIVLPMFHEISFVNMKTLRLEVRRSGDGALITRDRMRVDVGVEFYVSVNATVDGVSRAAQTLGDRTFDVAALREMIEGKLVDGLRAVAARMSMDELHENRSDFVQEVKNTVAEDLTKNGLELESVSLTALDQTPFEALDENNAFNAVGMRRLAEVIATSKKERAEIEAQADVAVRLSHMEAEKRKLEIERDEEQARLAQQQALEETRAAQRSEIALKNEAATRRAEEARIERERQVREAEIARERELEAATRAAEEARIERERAVREAEIQRDRELDVAAQEKAIVIAQKSEEESRARALADEARAVAAKAAEAILTAKEVAEAERVKAIALIEATREAEREATRVRLAAEADKDAAADRAEARREEAQAEADAIRIRAEAKREDMAVEAEGQRALIDAENALGAALIEMKLKLAEIDAAPKLAAELVRPAEKIESIRIHQLQGLGASGGTSGSGGASGGTPVNQALDSILGMALQLPTMQALGEDLKKSLGADAARAMATSAPTPAAKREMAAPTPAALPDSAATAGE